MIRFQLITSVSSGRVFIPQSPPTCSASQLARQLISKDTAVGHAAVLLRKGKTITAPC